MKKFMLFVMGGCLLTLVSCDKYSPAELETVKPKWIQYDNSPVTHPASPYLTFDFADSVWSFNTFGTQDDTTLLVIENPNSIPFSVNFDPSQSSYNAGMNWYHTNWSVIDRQNLINNGDTVIVVISSGTGLNVGDIRKLNMEVKYETKLIRTISYTFTRDY